MVWVVLLQTWCLFLHNVCTRISYDGILVMYFYQLPCSQPDHCWYHEADDREFLFLFYFYIYTFKVSYCVHCAVWVISPNIPEKLLWYPRPYRWTYIDHILLIVNFSKNLKRNRFGIVYYMWWCCPPISPSILITDKHTNYCTYKNGIHSMLNLYSNCFQWYKSTPKNVNPCI